MDKKCSYCGSHFNGGILERYCSKKCKREAALSKDEKLARKGEKRNKNVSEGSSSFSKTVVSKVAEGYVKRKESELREQELELKEQELELKDKREKEVLKKQQIDEIIHMEFPENAKGIYTILNTVSLKALNSFHEKGFNKNLYHQSIAKIDLGLKELKFLFDSDSKAEMYYKESLLEKNKLLRLRKKKKFKSAIIITAIVGFVISFLGGLEDTGYFILGISITVVAVIVLIYFGYIKK